MQPLHLKKTKVPQGKSVRVNLKLSEAALKSFDEIKARQAYKVNADVFDYVSQIVEMNLAELGLDNLWSTSIKEDQIPPPTTRKIFTLNEYTLAKLRKIAKTHDLSLDEVVNRSLYVINQWITNLKAALNIVKYEKEEYVLAEIGEIWSRVTDLRYGLEAVFPQDYDPTDPENMNCWFANIEGGLQELEDLVEKLFQERAKKNQN